jgi:hypothetical protein
MTSAWQSHKDIVTLVIAALGMLLTFFFGHFKNWRHRICFDYDSKHGAAITAIKDQFEEEAEMHFKSVQNAVVQPGLTIQQVYQSVEQKKYIKSLANKLESANQIRRDHHLLILASQYVEWGIWTLSVLISTTLVTIWWPFPHSLAIAAQCVGGILFLGIVALVCLLLKTEAHFFRITQEALRPELT